MDRSHQKIALITGGSRGLGKSMALALARKNHDILLTYHRQKDEAEKVIAEIKDMGQRAHAFMLDVEEQKSFTHFAHDIRELLASWGSSHFDFLINNAGIGLYASFLDTKEEDFDRLMNIHFKSPFFLTQHLVPLIKDGGRIVNISSGLARFSLPGYSAYAAMKGAMETLTRYQAKELANRRIGSICVAPGAIETDFGGGVVRDNKEINQQIAQSTALGRVGKAEDIGPAVATLLSDDCYWINGQRIEIAGGIFL